MSKLQEVQEQNHSLKNKIGNIREHAEAGVTSVVSAALAAGTGGALGLAAAYNKDKPGEIPEVQGVPVSAIVGVMAHLLAISGGTKKKHMAAYFRSIGDGGLAVAMADYMKVKGKEWKEEDSTTGTGVGAKGRKFGDALRQSIDALSSGSGSAVTGFSSLPVSTYG